jgi:hypothetical protein
MKMARVDCKILLPQSMFGRISKNKGTFPRESIEDQCNSLGSYGTTKLGHLILELDLDNAT